MTESGMQSVKLFAGAGGPAMGAVAEKRTGSQNILR